MRFCLPAILWNLLAVLLLNHGSVPATELIEITHTNYNQVVPAGKEVDAIVGDYVLRNERVTAVIAQATPDRKANMTVRGVAGMLIDFTRRHHGSDQLSCFYPAAGRFLFEQPEGVQGQVDGKPIRIDSGQRPEGRSTPQAIPSQRFQGKTISLSFTGKPLAEDGTQASVTYTLADGQDWIAYTVELTNAGSAAVALPIEEALRCDGNLFTDVSEPDLKLFATSDLYFGQSYGFMLVDYTIETNGSGRNLRLKSANQPAANPVEPGKSVVWNGRVYCSQGIPGVRSWAEGQLTDTPTENMQLNLQAPEGPVAHATLEFWRAGKTLGKIHSDKEGIVRTELLPAAYKVVISSQGRESREIEFTIESGKPQASSLTLPAASRVRGEIVDGEGQAMAAKIQFIGLDDTTDPNFGPDSAAEAVKNVVYSARGSFEQAIDPGRYRVIISHGPEYDAETKEIEVTQGQLVSLKSKLPRTVDTTGWVSGEFHSHSSPSGDNVSDQRGRVLNLLAEHIEFAPCTEHNRIDTYADDLHALRASDAMATCTGMELTGSPLPINHQNAFPLHRHEHEQDGGGPHTDADPVKQIERLALWDNNSSKVVQTNHPNIPQILGDVDLDGQPDAGFRGMLGWMDAIEVHPPEGIFTPPAAALEPDKKGQNAIFYWLQLLNMGYRITGVVNTDAHYNFHGSGWLRNYLESSKDDPAQISVEEMIHAAEHGHLVMTTGPFLQVKLRTGSDNSVAEYAAGDNVKLSPEAAAPRLWIRVQCPNWFDINRVQVFANGRPLEQFNFTRKTHADAFSEEHVRFEQEIELPKFEQDTHIIVATIGEGLTLGPVMGTDRGKLPPVAVTNPIFVDTDGSGFQANGDDLGVPFMLPENDK